MTMKLSDKDIAEILQLCDSASSGPWEYEYDGGLESNARIPNIGATLPQSKYSAYNADLICRLRNVAPLILKELLASRSKLQQDLEHEKLSRESEVTEYGMKVCKLQRGEGGVLMTKNDTIVNLIQQIEEYRRVLEYYGDREVVVKMFGRKELRPDPNGRFANALLTKLPSADELREDTK